MHTHTTHPTGISQQDRLSWLRWDITWSVGIAAVLGLGLLTPATIQARTFQCRAGDVACLVASIKQANVQPGPRHEIWLAAGVYTLITVDNETDGPNGLPSITSQLTIKGVGAGSTVIERDSNAFVFRLLHVAATGHLTLEGLTVRGGLSFPDFGGGLFNDQGTVTIINSTLADNFVHGPNDFGSGGGLFNLDGTVMIINSTLAHNAAIGDHPDGGGVNSGTLTISSSTLAHNAVIGRVRTDARPGSRGGGLFNIGSAVLVNTIVALNTTSDTGPDCIGTVTSQGYNLLGDLTDCTIDLQDGDLTGESGLAEFTDNEIPGQGHFPLLFGSQAINAGNPAVCPRTDQLGQPRIGICDIGAIEFQGQAVSSR